MAWLRERRLRRGSSTSPAGTLVADKADAGESCPVAVVAGEGLVWIETEATRVFLLCRFSLRLSMRFSSTEDTAWWMV